MRGSVSDIPPTFEPMVLHVSDISVIANREHNRYFEHTKIQGHSTNNFAKMHCSIQYDKKKSCLRHFRVFF